MKRRKRRRRKSGRPRRRAPRELRLESLEDRMLLAQLVSVLTPDGQLLNDGDVLNVAPRDLTLRFEESLNPAIFENEIVVTRSGSDGTFGDGNEVVIQPGFIGIGELPNEAIFRFSETQPDDRYRINILGVTPSQLDFNLNLGAQVVAVVPQPISRNPLSGALEQARDQIVVHFNNDDLLDDATSAENPDFYQLIFTNDTISNTDDVVHNPTSVAYDASTDTAVLTFASDLDALSTGVGTYRLRIGTDERTGADDWLPPPPISVDPPPASAQFDFDTGGAVSVEFTALDDLGTAVRVVVSSSDPGHSGSPQISAVGTNVFAVLNANAGNETTAQELVDAINANVKARALITASIASGDPDTNIGSPLGAATTLVLTGLGSSFDTASDLGLMGRESQILSSDIDPQFFPFDFPGASDDPGHRDIPVQDHLLGLFAGAGGGPEGDLFTGITTIPYNFQDVYGRDPQQNELHNLITDAQKQRAREIFEIYAALLGIQFVETAAAGLTIVTGDLRALSPGIDTGPSGVIGLAGGGIAIMDNAEPWNDAFGISDDPQRFSWFDTAMHEIGHLLGLGHTHEQPQLTIMGDSPFLNFTNNPEPVFPGDHDIVHGRHLHRPEANDIDLYRFEVQNGGVFTAETIAERLERSSFLDTALNLYKERPNGSRELLSRNDDYFSEDSFIEMPLDPGTYYIGVSASGNLAYDPTIENTGFGGTSDGPYDLRLSFRPAADVSIVDADLTGTALTPTQLDGDADGVPGGDFNFWFRVVAPEDTLFVDKSHNVAAGPVGTLANPYDNLAAAFAAVQPGDVIRIEGNGGADGNLETLGDNLAYQIGFDSLGQPLADGSRMNVPQGVTVMIDAGSIFKLRRARIGVGSSSISVDRSDGALQVLGTPDQSVHFTSFNDEQIGVDTNPNQLQTPASGDWGGIVIRNDLDRAEGRRDLESEGIFLNYVNHADIRYGGGNVVIDSVSQVVTPVHLIDARATVTFNTITRSADAAISANPNSFEESNFHAPDVQTTPFTSDYSRIGPDIHGNRLADNSINGLFIRISTPAGNQLQRLTVPGRLNDTDIVHVLLENLRIEATPGGPLLDEDTFELHGRPDARLAIDPSIILKIDSARIETGIGAQLIAEGLPGRPVVFTSLFDDRFGAGSTFDTSSNGSDNLPAPGDWGGIYVGHVSTASLDQTMVAFGGGLTRVEGSFTGFNAVEVHQADARITNSIFEDNASGFGGQASPNRSGRGPNGPGAIFVRGAQPIIVGNVIRRTNGPAVNINANSLNHFLVADYGRTTGHVQLIDGYADNQGPLVRENQIINVPNSNLQSDIINGMLVRGATLTTQSVWDDTDIVHVLRDEIVVPDFHTFGGLRLESSANESLVVKLSGASAGFRATGGPLQFELPNNNVTTLAGDIDDRIGGILQVIGQPGRPVVLTSLADDQVGAGLKPNGAPQTDTNNDANFTTPQRGDWQGLTIGTYAHDRNVAVVTEAEIRDALAPGTNATPETAQFLGELAPHEKAGDDIRRLGYEIHGLLNRPDDVDVYSFRANAGSEIWLDIDRTSTTLDSVVELVDANGQVVARSDNSHAEEAGLEERFVNTAVFEMSDERREVGDLTKSTFLPRDDWTTNRFDAGMRLVLPGSTGTTTTFHVRVRSSSDDLDGNLFGGLTSGAYQLQIRLSEVDELPGSTVEFADIGFAVNGVAAFGQPIHSPLLGETAESEDEFNRNDAVTSAQTIGNVLTTDRAALSVAGNLSPEDDVDWYQFDVDYGSTQLGGDFASITFDIDYADGFANADTSLSVYYDNPATGQIELVLSGTASNIADDRPAPLHGADVDDLSRGTLGAKDPFIGPVELAVGRYYVAVSADNVIPQVLDQFVADAGNPSPPTDPLVRIEPVDSLQRVADEHLGGPGATASDPRVLDLFEVGDQSGPVPFHLGDVVLFTSVPFGLGTAIRTVDPFTGTVETTLGIVPGEVGDIAMRSDGTLYSLTMGDDDADSGHLLLIDTGDASVTDLGDDGIVTMQRVFDDMDPPMPTDQCEASDVGIQFNALTVGTAADNFMFFAVGDRGDGVSPDPSDPDSFGDNILYTLAGPFDPNFPIGAGTPPDLFGGGPRCGGAGTNIIELGRIDVDLGPSPGGMVTGLAIVGGQRYAVDNLGELFRVSGGGLFGGMTTEYVDVEGSLRGIPFSGLAAGPPDVQDGRYAEMLFGIDTSGRIHAFDTEGNLQPIFVDGATSIATGAPANGLAFSNLDENLWHISAEDGQAPGSAQPGHGFEVPVTQSRLANSDGPTLYFGNDTEPFSQDNPTGNQTGFDVNFPGGAHGSVVSKSIDLSGYTAADQPVLYFNYFLDTENTDYAPGPTSPIRDSFRVFISDDSNSATRGAWHLLGTNDSFRSRTMADEFDSPFGAANNQENYGPIQELFDNRFDDLNNDGFKETLVAGTGTWRQARIPLDAFAGSESLRLRFDFSTAGSMNLGDKDTTGSELRAIIASELRDAQTLRIDTDSFEVDLGITLVAPTGAAIQDGETLTVGDGLAAAVTFEFDNDGAVDGSNTPIALTGNETASNVAQKIETALAESDLFHRFTVIIPAGDQLADGDDVTLEDQSGTVVVFEFDRDGILNDPGAEPVLFQTDETARRVTNNFRDAVLASGLSGVLATPSGMEGNRLILRRVVSASAADAGGSSAASVEVEDSIHRVGNRLNLEGLLVSVTQSPAPAIGLLGSPGVDGANTPIQIHLEMTASEVADAITLALANTYAGGVTDVIRRFGDTIWVVGHDVTSRGPFGLADALPGDQFGAFNASVPLFAGAPRGQDNQHEGVFIDDVVIGFAERGEMITYAQTSTGRGNTNFVENLSVLPDGIVEGEYQLEIRRSAEYGVPSFNPPLQLTRSFDTNDRLSQEFHLSAPTGSEVVTGQIFTLSDGVNSATFEYIDASAGVGATGEHVPIFFDPSSDAAAMALRIRDAINSNRAQNTLGLEITASANGTSNRVDLFGDPIRLDTPQLVVTDTVSDGNLLRDILLGPGITPVGDALFVGSETSAGLFEGGASSIGLNSGILLTTGNANIASGPNRDDGGSGLASEEGDADLDAEFGVVTTDSTVLQFDFESVSGDLFFNFVFASEEYNEFSNSVFNDVFAFFLDGVNIAMVPGTSDPISINTINGGDPLGTGARNAGFYHNNDRDDNGTFLTQLGYDGFTSVFTATATGLAPGTHNIKLAIADVDDQILDAGVFIEAGSFDSDRAPVVPSGIPVRRFNETGDENRFRDQGQLLIQSSRIHNSQQFGIVVDASPRDLLTDNPHLGSPRNLREVNLERLAPGVTIKNNIVSGGNQGGIHFSGQTNSGFEPAAAVPFGRIVNNTLFGRGGNLFPQSGSDIGIVVDNNASPTVLNNILANFQTGIDVDSSSSTTVLGGTLYQGNDLDSSRGLGDFPIQLSTFDPLFVNVFAGNFYLTAGAAAIDSSVDSIEDRPNMVIVRNPLGIPVSPILAPERDFRGQLRVDDPDVDTPAGVGENVFKDRGAIDRADFSGPNSVLVTPRDNDSAGNDQNPVPTVVQSRNVLLDNFSIQINDGIAPGDPLEGTGVADATVASRTVTLTRNGVRLVPNIDYQFTYNTTNDVIRLTPATGVWRSNSTYVLTLDNSVATGIKDLANNPLKGNQQDGTVQFTIVLGPARDYGDAPDPPYPTLSASGGPSHILGSGLILGSTADPDSDGQPTAAANGDGADDDGVVFGGSLIVNAVVPLTVTASAPGRLDAWIDFTGDGDFNDAGEQIFASRSLASGANSLSVPIPSFATLGTTYGRFRLSSAGGLLPGGSAADGEVEDYVFVIEGNPWQNASNRLDVDGNGEVEPLDALIIFNVLNAVGPGPLPIPPVSPPPPPPFLDVDGNGMVEPLDALIIINNLNLPGATATQTFVQASVHAGEPTPATVGGELGNPQFSVGGDLRDPQFATRVSGSLRDTPIDPGHLRIAADDYFQDFGRRENLESSTVITEPLDSSDGVGGELRETPIDARVSGTRRAPHGGSSAVIDRSAVDRTAWRVDEGILTEIAADVREGWEVKRQT